MYILTESILNNYQVLLAIRNPVKLIYILFNEILPIYILELCVLTASIAKIKVPPNKCCLRNMEVNIHRHRP